MTERQFGAYVTKLIRGIDLTRDETTACFTDIIQNAQSDMQQGAFLAALAAKGETEAEIAAAWRVIYELDTVKVGIGTDQPVAENCGTGMDAVKTFNISTAASLVAASDGVPMARHGSRAVTSACGTVDLAEALGVNVECPPETVKRSIETAGIGLFNGASPLVHPNKALSRILSQISFGSVLNIAASLANPARPRIAVRGVYSPDLLGPTAKVMKEIGYARALVVHGEAEPGRQGGIDEASTMGRSHICELTADGKIVRYEISPDEFGIETTRASDLAGLDKAAEAARMRDILSGAAPRAWSDIVGLNAGLILYAAGKQPTIKAGFERARSLLSAGEPIHKLDQWVCAQQ